MVKKRISATVDEKTLKLIRQVLKQGKYRNKSHVVEEAVKKLAENDGLLKDINIGVLK